MYSFTSNKNFNAKLNLGILLRRAYMASLMGNSRVSNVIKINAILCIITAIVYFLYKEISIIIIGFILMMFVVMLLSKGDIGNYVAKRILLAMLTIVIISAITFFTMNTIPGGPFDQEKALDPAVKATLESRFNLDKPLGQQYLLYMNSLLHGDMGISLKNGRDISEIIFGSFSISAKIGGGAVLVALICGLILGSAAALNSGGVIDRLIIFFTTLFVAVPSFILATILMLVFCLQLKLVPVFTIDNPSYVLPIISLALYPMSYITRLTKSSMLDVLGQDYIRTAKAKGVKDFFVIGKHALKNALIPVITYLGPLTAYILTGSMVVETVFTIGGLGTKFVQGITNRDYSLIMGCTIFLSILMVIMTLISDLIYKAADPRISFK